MLKQRVITAIVLLLILIGSYWLGPVEFAGVMAVAFILAQWEWLKLAGLSSAVSAVIAILVGGSISGLTYLAYLDLQMIDQAAREYQMLYANLSGIFVMYLAVITLLWVGISIRVFFARNTGLPVNKVVVGVTGVFFPPAAWLAFVAMYASFGITMVISLLAIVWVADIMAYFTGMAFGKHRMSPAISPKKSWEGVAGGMLSVMILGLIFAWFFSWMNTIPGVIVESMGVVAWIVAAFILVSLSIVGDVFESALKRQAGIKDSSNLLPGHGGFYDRLDAMMPTLPAGFLLTVLILSGTIG